MDNHVGVDWNVNKTEENFKIVEQTVFEIDKRNKEMHSIYDSMIMDCAEEIETVRKRTRRIAIAFCGLSVVVIVLILYIVFGG